MSLKPIVEKIFKKFTDYKQPDQAVTQMSSLGSLSGDLYQDSKRFIYELLQNADDSSVGNSKIRVVIKLFAGTLVVGHTGKTFDDRDVVGISDVGNGTKKSAGDKTGYKGIGFKSVFGQSNRVSIYSDSELFRFDENYHHDWNPEWGGTQEDWEAENNLQFKYPWPIIPIYTEYIEISSEIWNFLEESDYKVASIIELHKPAQIATALGELLQKVEMYLFLKNINEIIFDAGERTTIGIMELANGEVGITVNGEEKVKYLKKVFDLNIPEEVQTMLQSDRDIPEKIKYARKAEIVLAAKIGTTGFEVIGVDEKNLYAYLPTEEKTYHIPVLVNASFYLAATRENLHKDSVWNKWLMKQIPVLLVQWIAHLVTTDIGSDAYTILPKKLNSFDSLAANYNAGLEYAKHYIPFIPNSEGLLLTSTEALLDFSFLSTQAFVGKIPIINYITQNQRDLILAENPFPKDLSNTKLRGFGVRSFEWRDFPNMVLMTPIFKQSLTLENNKLLINYLKYQSLSGADSQISDTILKGWDFIRDHKGNLKAPRDLYFSEIGLTPDIDSEYSFVHPELEEWIIANTEVKLWLESLNIQEKSDVTFLTKTIIPNAETFSTNENAIQTIHNISGLLAKGEIGLNTPPLLAKLKILTTKGTLVSAENCYLSNSYEPRVKIEELIEDDIFISTNYIIGNNVDALKTLFKHMGVKEELEIDVIKERVAKQNLIDAGLEQAYFDQHINIFHPLKRYFTPFDYQNISYSHFLSATYIKEFSKLFWKNIIDRTPAEETQKLITAFWGDKGWPGYSTGDELENYLSWFVQNRPSIPTIKGTCHPASEVFLNSEEIKSIAGKYLPVFDGPELRPAWKDFFQFKSELNLFDLLELLTKIGTDPDHTKTAQQAVIGMILENYSNYTVEDLQAIQHWGSTAYLSDNNGIYRTSKDLHFYIDGNPSDFGENYHFAYFSQGLRNHKHFEDFLVIIGVTVIKQSAFIVNAEEIVPAKSLMEKLEFVLPYWAQWRREEKQSGIEQMLDELKVCYVKYTFLQADELMITFGQNWKRKTTGYLSTDSIYVISNWKKLGVLMSLGPKLCQIFNSIGYEEQLKFLLLSEKKEIEEYFTENGVGLPPLQYISTGNNRDSEIQDPVYVQEKSDFDLSPKPIKDYNALWVENLENNQALIDACDGSAQKLLLNGLRITNTGQINIFHFTHIENAVSIIRDNKIKSRGSASFKDSAGSGIIAQTIPDRKSYARFYFRPKTPTQFYVENLGQGNNSIEKIKSDPLCPVPIFFIIPLEPMIDEVDWKVSLGSMASSNVKYGNDLETISQFDFLNINKGMSEMSKDRFTVTAQQEFLVKDELDLTGIQFQLAVQNEAAKESLLSLLENDEEFKDKIIVNPALYHNVNPQVKIDLDNDITKVNVTANHPGQLILQYETQEHSKILCTSSSSYFTDKIWSTTVTENTLEYSKDKSSNSKFKLFYQYKGYLWFIHSNGNEMNFNMGWIKNNLSLWLDETDSVPMTLIKILKQHPVINYLYNQDVGGLDELTLEAHSLAVINNYLTYFKGTQDIFPRKNEFILFLALHDIGKPAAIQLGSRRLQHKESIRILNDLENMFPISLESFNKIKTFIDGDPLGEHLNSLTNIGQQETRDAINKMSEKLGEPIEKIFKNLTIYYQCDAAGYDYLRNKLFLTDDHNQLKIDESESKLLFKDELESKFGQLKIFMEIA